MALGSDFTQVLAAAKSGAEWAWADIYRNLAGHVTAYLAARGAPEPEDLTSEVFLQAARDIASFHGDESGFRSWVFVIAHRRLVDSWRAASRRPSSILMLEGMAEPSGGNAEEEALERLRTTELLSAFERLTEDQPSDGDSIPLEASWTTLRNPSASLDDVLGRAHEHLLQEAMKCQRAPT
jgi:RNA polymerase sigma-70 factor (ECF subfamily)